MEKFRLDILLKEKGLFESREKAKQAILNSLIKINGKVVTDSSKKFDLSINVEVLGEPNKYVSRGAKKLEKALDVFNIDVKNKVATDIGSSTGGFSDVLLQNGIKKIYCIDVGKDQLHSKIRNDEKTVVMEETDFRDIDKNIIKDTNLIVIDVSFISIESIVKKIKDCFDNKNVEVVSLIKPQFECGKDIAKKYKGVIKNKLEHKNIINKVLSFWFNNGFSVKGITVSPITGGDGNIEYLLYTTTEKIQSIKINIESLVENAFNEHKKS